MLCSTHSRQSTPHAGHINILTQPKPLSQLSQCLKQAPDKNLCLKCPMSQTSYQNNCLGEDWHPKDQTMTDVPPQELIVQIITLTSKMISSALLSQNLLKL